MAHKNRSVSPVSSITSHNPREQPKERDVQAKPLPRLPRTWSRVCHETGLFLRSIGLGVVVSTISGLFRKDFIEPTKVAISRNQVTASLRTLVHILPLGIAILEIVLNWGGFYYGADFTQLAYYQIAAKTHEITIQASLALVTLAVIRHEATSGAGLPFGAFLGGLQFLQVGYLWSPELWSSIAAKDFGWRRKIWVFLILIICGILATTVGPSSATLLIPRQIYWALPYSHFAVNGSFQDIWPDSVNGSMVPQECGRLSSASVSISPCPGGPWLDLYHTLQSEGTAFDVNVQSNALAENIFHDPLLPALKASVAKLCQTSTKDQVCGTTLHDVVLEAAYSNYQEFRGNYHIKKSFQDIEHEFHNGYFQPYTIASCFADVIQESNIEEPLQFPRISETPSELSQERVLISVSYPTRAEVLDTAGNASEFRLEWTELPQNTFGDQVIGVILLYPQDPKSNSSMNITTCTLGAGWGTSLINLSEFYGDVYFSRMHGLPAYWPNRVQTVIRNIAQGLPNYANISGYTFPQRRINIAKDWAEYLNPTIEIAGNQTTTAINMLISANPGQVEGVGIPRTLVSMLSNGLARNGIERGFQATIDAATPCEDCLQFDMSHNIYGYGYDIRDTTTQLAVAVMVTYCIIAFAHIIYLGAFGISSMAWDSTAEMMALAMNSSPTKHLQNTCAGIIGIKPFQTRVRILASKSSGAGEEDHLELVFGEIGAPDAHMEKLKLNQKYGNLHEY